MSAVRSKKQQARAVGTENSALKSCTHFKWRCLLGNWPQTSKVKLNNQQRKSSLKAENK